MPPKKGHHKKRRHRGGGFFDGLVDGFTAPIKLASSALNAVGLKPSQLAALHPATRAAVPVLSMLGQGRRRTRGGARAAPPARRVVKV